MRTLIRFVSLAALCFGMSYVSKSIAAPLFFYPTYTNSVFPSYIVESPVEAVHAYVNQARYYSHSYQTRWPEIPSQVCLARLLTKLAQNRMIVAGNRDSKMPTWDGHVPALIIDPMIWYFEPPLSPVRGLAPWPTTGGEFIPVPHVEHTPMPWRPILENLLDIEDISARAQTFQFWGSLK